MSVVFVDTETTGLDPDRHEIWEVAAIWRADSNDRWIERVWQLPVDLGRADSKSLELNNYHERARPTFSDALALFANDFASITRGKHLVGAVISFDEERLRKLLRANGACPEWHYHLIDVEALVAGKLGIRPPWNSEELAEKVGVKPPEGAERHTALADARWAKAMYEAVMS